MVNTGPIRVKNGKGIINFPKHFTELAFAASPLRKSVEMGKKLKGNSNENSRGFSNVCQKSETSSVNILKSCKCNFD